MDCSLLGSSVHGIFQTRILQWVAISFSGDLPDSGIEPGSQADALPSEPRGKIFWDNRISQKVFRKEKLPSSRIHCCYIILSTEFKLNCLLGSHQFWAYRKKFYVTKNKECRERKKKKKMFVLSSSLRTPDPYLRFEGPRPLSPPWGPQTSYQPAYELTLSALRLNWLSQH